nr:hypothetical protein [Tanacetum cinerariifolium]
MLLEGSELTKEDRESQLYDDFEHFRQHKGKTIHDYYVWFAKLINDMRNIKMTMSKMQLNSKFVNNMLPEWSRFVTAVTLNRGLRDSNYDQLYAYLKQHDAHANKNKMMLDRFTQHTVDPLALMSNVSHPQDYLPSSSTPPSTYVPPHLTDNAHLDSILFPMDNLIEYLTNTLALLTQSYKTFLLQTNNQLRTSSNTRNQAIVQDSRDLALNVNNVFQANNCDVFNFDVDEAPTAQTMFMANLSSADHVNDEVGLSYDSNILSEKFEGIQKALTKEIIEMKDVFEELEAEVAQNVVDRKHDEIERKNLLIANNNLIVECLSKEVFSFVMDSKLNVARFTEMHVSNTIVEAHCLKLETELSNLRDKSHNDNHDELVNRFCNLETCKERITPTVLTEGERGFEQTKECYLTEVILFFKTLKEHFEGIQKALTTEIKEMKIIFDELEAEVDQPAVNRKCDEIEWKNLLIANDTLIANFLSKEVFYIATNS